MWALVAAGECHTSLIGFRPLPGPTATRARAHACCRGQAALSPTAAQTIFSAVPLLSALVAAVALGGEEARMGPLSWAGAAAIVGAGLWTAAYERAAS